MKGFVSVCPLKVRGGGRQTNECNKTFVPEQTHGLLLDANW